MPTFFLQPISDLLSCAAFLCCSAFRHLALLPNCSLSSEHSRRPATRGSGVLLSSLAGIGAALLLPNSSSALTVFSDDFESGLGNWTVGGRQAEGINIADTVQRHGSSVGHLYKFSFTEITLDRTFDFDPAERFFFDMEVAVSSTPPPAPNYYGSAGVDFDFRNSLGQSLGRVLYMAATTSFIYTNFLSDPTTNVNQITAGSFDSYAFLTSDLLSQISIDEGQIAQTLVRFSTYSSTRPAPTVTAELWVDNFSTVPEPSTALLISLGLVALGFKRVKSLS